MAAVTLEENRLRKLGPHTRADFTSRTKRILAGRVGWRCSNPACRAPTTGPSTNTESISNVGEAAHITAAARRGPRFDPGLTYLERMAVANGIWLCRVCAKMVDDDPTRYHAAILRFWREDAETLADYEKGLPANPSLPIRFTSIQIDSRCLWTTAHRLHKVQTRTGGRPDFGFHQIPERNWEGLQLSLKTHFLDPILDVVLANDTNQTTVIGALGFEPVAVWTALKGLPTAYKVPVLDGYTLRVRRAIPGQSQMLILTDPIAVPPHGTGRFKLGFRGFRKAIRGNESLIRLSVRIENLDWKSRVIYMGVY